MLEKKIEIENMIPLQPIKHMQKRQNVVSRSGSPSVRVLEKKQDILEEALNVSNDEMSREAPSFVVVNKRIESTEILQLFYAGFLSVIQLSFHLSVVNSIIFSFNSVLNYDDDTIFYIKLLSILGFLIGNYFYSIGILKRFGKQFVIITRRKFN